MKKLLLTLNDNDQVIIEDLKEIWHEKTETATIRKALKYAYASKETIQKQIKEDALDDINLFRRINKNMLKELDEESRMILANELYNSIFEKH